MNTPDKYDEQAERALRLALVPNYNSIKPINEMTQWEQGQFRFWTPVIAAALREQAEAKPLCARCGPITHSRGRGDIDFHCATCWRNLETRTTQLEAALEYIRDWGGNAGHIARAALEGK